MVASRSTARPGCGSASRSTSDPYWLLVDPHARQPVAGSTWLVWLVSIALLATIFGSAVIARLINRPLKQLSFAASRIRDGEFDVAASTRTRCTNEIREVNIGFNRMARELAKVEQDRAVMLAGISHDLRTPLARLRLEAEMSVADEEAQRNMALDIDQLDAIIDKFIDYARPERRQAGAGAPVERGRPRDGRLPRSEGDPHRARASPSTPW